MMTIEQAKELWLKNKDRHIYDVVWKGNECIHKSRAYHYYVICDGKVVSRHKTYKNALESEKRNPFHCVKTAYELFGPLL